MSDRRGDDSWQAWAAGAEAAPVVRAVLRVVPSEAPYEPANGTAETHLFLMGWVYPLVDPVVSLGRGLENNAVLLDPSISREHAVIREDTDGWFIANRSQRRPLWVGEQRLAPGEEGPLAPGAMLLLGATRLQFLAPHDARMWGVLSLERADRSPASEPARALAPGVTLQFALGGRGGRAAWWIAGAAGLVMFGVCGILTLATLLVLGRQAVASGGLGGALEAVAIPVMPALGVGLLVALLDRYEREPLSLLAAAFLWGAVIAIPLALFAERALDAALATLATPNGAYNIGGALAQALSAGLLEEAVKGAGLVLLLLLLRDQFDNVTDGILYGLVIGAGFAMVENFAYFARSPSGDLPGLIFGRILLGWLGHSTFSALFGAGLGYWREQHTRGRLWRAPLAGFSAAVALHAIFDLVVLVGRALGAGGAPSAGATALILLLGAYAPLFGGQAVLLRLLLASLRREAEVIRAQLVDEVLGGGVAPDEYVIVQDAVLRGRVERRLLLTAGLRAYLLGRGLHAAIIGLALRKWHVVAGDAPKPGARQPEDAYRERIASLRVALLALPQKA
jgi:RsiW-degrading membrane proteinase PrsW (M82 family)